MKLVVIGAGSTYSPEIFDGLIRYHETIPVTEVDLMDIDERKLNIVGNFIQRMLDSAGMGHIRCRLLTDLDTALQNADYVIAQIRVGQMQARIKDEKIPLKYGMIGQETTGIGGFFNGLRTIPEVMHIAKRMEVLCPNAWLINFSNPSGMIAQAVRNHSSIKMVGLCNCALNMFADVRKWLNDPEAEIEYMGLNHLTWITKVMSHGENKLPELLKSGNLSKQKNNPTLSIQAGMLETIGGIPSSYLQYFYQRDKQLDLLLHGKESRGEVCQRIEDQLLELYQKPELTRKPELLSQRGGALYSEAAVSLIDCIENDRHESHVVNIENKGAMPFLRDDDIVEISCTVSRNAIEPQPITVMPNDHMIALIQTVKAYERLAIEAALTGSREAAMQALLVHPLAGDYERSKACFDEMLEAHKEYLSVFFK